MMTLLSGLAGAADEFASVDPYVYKYEKQPSPEPSPEPGPESTQKEPPLVEVPATGGVTAVWLVVSGLSATGLIGLHVTEKKKGNR